MITMRCRKHEMQKRALEDSTVCSQVLLMGLVRAFSRLLSVTSTGMGLPGMSRFNTQATFDSRHHQANEDDRLTHNYDLALAILAIVESRTCK